MAGLGGLFLPVAFGKPNGFLQRMLYWLLWIAAATSAVVAILDNVPQIKDRATGALMEACRRFDNSRACPWPRYMIDRPFFYGEWYGQRSTMGRLARHRDAGRVARFDELVIGDVLVALDDGPLRDYGAEARSSTPTNGVYRKGQCIRITSIHRELRRDEIHKDHGTSGGWIYGRLVDCPRK
jgi:hypothetical protein